MASAATVQSHQGLSGLLFISLLALQYALISSADVVVKVTQEPPFASKSKGETLTLTCAVDKNEYYVHWYRQQPGQTELQHLGTFPAFNKALEKPGGTLDERLSGERNNNNASLNLGSLQSSDIGFYLCAAKDTVVLEETGACTKLSTGNRP